MSTGRSAPRKEAVLAGAAKQELPARPAPAARSGSPRACPLRAVGWPFPICDSASVSWSQA